MRPNDTEFGVILELYEGDFDRANAIIETFEESWQLGQIKTGLKSRLPLFSEVNVNGEVALNLLHSDNLRFYASEAKKYRLSQYKWHSVQTEKIIDSGDILQSDNQKLLASHQLSMNNPAARIAEATAFRDLVTKTLVESGVPAEILADR